MHRSSVPSKINVWFQLPWQTIPNSLSNSFATPWTVACQAPLSMGFSRQEYWSGLPLPSPGELPDPGIKPKSPALQADSFTIWATREALAMFFNLCVCVCVEGEGWGVRGYTSLIFKISPSWNLPRDYKRQARAEGIQNGFKTLAVLK